MHRILWFLSLCCLISCSEEPGRIDVFLDATSVEEISQIQKFIFIVSQINSEGVFSQVLYPDKCGGWLNDQASHTPENVCLLMDCGFDIDKTEFQVEVAFSNFVKNSDISIIACALGSNQTIVAGAKSDMKNKNGVSVKLSLDPNSVICTETLPTFCQKS